MKIESRMPLFTTYYNKLESAKITHSTADVKQDIIKFYVSDELINDINTKVDGYQGQFGITISYDNTKCFIQYWEKPSIMCYSILDGKVLWEYKKLGHINRIVEHCNKIYCGQEEKGIVIISTATGEEMDMIKGFMLQPYRINKDIFIIIQSSQNFYGCYDIQSKKLWKPKKCNEITEKGVLLFFEKLNDESIIFKKRRHIGVNSIEEYVEVKISDLF